MLQCVFFSRRKELAMHDGDLHSDNSNIWTNVLPDAKLELF